MPALGEIVPVRFSIKNSFGVPANPDEIGMITLFSEGVIQDLAGAGVSFGPTDYPGLFFAFVDLGDADLLASGFFARGKQIDLGMTGVEIDTIEDLGDWIGGFEIDDPLPGLVGALWRLSLTILHATTFVPIGFASITFRREDGTDVQSQIGDASGDVEQFLTDGDWIVVVARQGFVTQVFEVTIDGEDAELDVDLVPRGSGGGIAVPGLLRGRFLAMRAGVPTDGLRFKFWQTAPPTARGYAADTNVREAESATVGGEVGTTNLTFLMPTARYAVQDPAGIEPSFEFTAPALNDPLVQEGDDENDLFFDVESFLYRVKAT